MIAYLDLVLEEEMGEAERQHFLEAVRSSAPARNWSPSTPCRRRWRRLTPVEAVKLASPRIEAATEFELSPKTQELQRACSSSWTRTCTPRSVWHEQVVASGDPYFTRRSWRAEGGGPPARPLNLFLPDERYGAGLTNLEYAPLAEIMGRASSRRGHELRGARHRQHGDPGEFGTDQQRSDWLEPLLAGEIAPASR